MSGLVVYGVPLAGVSVEGGGRGPVSVVEVPVEVAGLFAAAHHRLRPEAVGVHLGGGEIEITHPAPVGPDGGTDRWVAPDEAVVEAVRSARAPVVLAGPGVVDGEAVPGLHALAAAGSLGVLNTWGAKGIFDWRSRHHLATAGLQADDFARAGFAGADLIIATGVDEAEAGGGAWRLAPVVEVHPWALGPLAERVGRPRAEVAMPPLRAELARVTQAGWARTGTPMPPTLVTRTYGATFAGPGLVAADPGVAGYWVARTLPTSGLRGAIVSRDATAEGSAVATAAVARLLDPRRPVLAVVDRIGPAAEAALEAAARLGVTVPVERWSDDGPALDQEAHAARLAGLVAAGGVADLAVDRSQLDEMVAVAGPVTAWGGLLAP